MSATSARARIHPPRKIPENTPNKSKKGVPRGRGEPEKTKKISKKDSQKTHIFIKKDMISGMGNACISGDNGKTDQKSCHTAGNNGSGAKSEKTQKYLLPHEKFSFRGI